jgi:hypothetical protein
MRNRLHRQNIPATSIFGQCTCFSKIRDCFLSCGCDVYLISFQANTLRFKKGNQVLPVLYYMIFQSGTKSVAVIVAHPDDETLWAGGTILMQPSWDWFILSLCRGNDTDRAPKFQRALQVLNAQGTMSDLDDGPEQTPLDKEPVQEKIIQLLPSQRFDRIISHSPAGEYTRHRRHEEVGEAVIALWLAGRLQAHELWTFAYEDGGKRYLPQPIRFAHIYQTLPDDIWQKKYHLITETYGFPQGGFEAQTTPRAESFWKFIDATKAHYWLENEVFQHESFTVI